MDKQVVVKDLLISYSQLGAGDGKVLLFLHGWRSSKEAWAGIAAGIQNSAYRVYALDLPGFGQSQSPGQGIGVGDYAKIVTEFIKKLELKNVCLVGHSFGGRVGIKLAACYPELIEKLVLVDSAGFSAEQSKKALMAAAAKVVKPFFKPKFMQPLRRKIYKQIGAEDYVATPELQQTFVNVVNEDLSADMKNIRCPTLIVSGENDADTPAQFGRRMQSLIANSKFEVINHADHFSFIDQPEKFVEMLRKFLS